MGMVNGAMKARSAWDTLVLPRLEAEGLARLVRTHAMTVEQVRRLIHPVEFGEFSAQGRREVLRHCSRSVIKTALGFRRRVLAEFDKLCPPEPQNFSRAHAELALVAKPCSDSRKEAAVETRTPTQEARPESQPGRSMRDVVAGQLCAECGVARATRAIGEKPLCQRCFIVETRAEAAS